jgi:uncharacterized protein (UPF0261 family)
MKRVYVIGTSDTKSEDLFYVAKEVQRVDVPTTIVDISLRLHQQQADILNTQVAAYHPSMPNFIANDADRGVSGMLMGEALSVFLQSRTDLGGVIGIGGSGNTAIITAAMRELPIGVPKLMVSTMASGDVGEYVGPTDITMMYSVTDIAGINPLSRVILGNAAHAIAAMVRTPVEAAAQDKPLLGMTMYGVTTPAVMAIQQLLRKTYDILIFHATGRGGQSLEKLIESKLISAVIDLTTTEVVDFLFDGLMSAGKDRLGAMIRTKIPYVASVGAFDIITFGSPEQVPSRYRQRLSHRHNANITLIRTTADECRIAGTWFAEKVNAMEGPVRILLPEGGLSQLDAPGQPFYDPVADSVLFDTIRNTIKITENRQVISLPYHINDPAFAREVVAHFCSLQNR